MARYRWNPEEGRLESLDTLPPEARIHLQTDAGFDGLRATDGADLTTRSKWKRYMHDNNLTLAADWKETWAARQKEREAWRTEGGDHARRKEAIRRVVYEMSPRDVRACGERARERQRQFGKDFRGD